MSTDSPTTPTAEGNDSNSFQSRFESEVGHRVEATRTETTHLLNPLTLRELHEDVLDLFAAGATGDERPVLAPNGRRGYLSVTVKNSQLLPAKRQGNNSNNKDQTKALVAVWCLFIVVMALLGVIFNILLSQ